MEQIMSAITGMFDTVKDNGVTIVIGAIAIGVIFVGAQWIWGQAKKWIKKVS